MPEQLFSPWLILARRHRDGRRPDRAACASNAFLALITAALVVSLLAPGDAAQKSLRVASAFGEAAGRIGIVIALASIVGKCMMDSGAADRVVRGFLIAARARSAAPRPWWRAATC